MRVPGLGPAKARALYAELGVSTAAELEQAARDGRLQAVPGFGDKLAESVLATLEGLRRRTDHALLSDAWMAAKQIREVLGEGVEVVGSVRRMQDTAGGLDLLAAGDDTAASERLVGRLLGLPNLVEVRERSQAGATVRLYGGLKVRLHVAPAASFGAALVWHTGSARHVARLQAVAAERGVQVERNAAFRTEEQLYAALGLPWIPPELREDQGEIEAAQAGTLPKLVELDDLCGDLHCHTDWTDGSESLEAMALAARARGYAYMALTDHSRSLTITNGLTLERLEQARRLVAQLNHRLAPFVILLGTEMDILADGQLDYPDETLASLDYVSASVHSRFKQPEAVMTARIVRAVTHPLVHTLNHPHGRLLTSRPAYAVDMPRVIEAATAAGCALEVSADPARMDLDGGWARRVKAAGGRCTISSDAHSTLDYANIWLGLGSARRGWLEAADVLNTRPLDELRALLRRPRQRA
jgi:DNA polymerase (family 10)